MRDVELSESLMDVTAPRCDSGASHERRIIEPGARGFSVFACEMLIYFVVMRTSIRTRVRISATA
jgi:hypothetical protein